VTSRQTRASSTTQKYWTEYSMSAQADMKGG